MQHDGKQELLESHQEFRHLYLEHQKCEGQLEALNGRTRPSQDDEAEAKRIKIHKLALKDRMEDLIRHHALP